MSGGDALATCRRKVRELQATSRAPSVVAAVSRGDELVWSECVGLADVETERVATLDTQYRIGSVTKTFTAVLLMQLRDGGGLELDDRLDRHLPDTRHSAVTLRQMLSHLSGLKREPAPGPSGELWETLEIPGHEEFLAGFESADPVLAPYRRWHYSNLAYAVLGEVVARGTSGSWETALRERLLEPLGLLRTTLDPVEPAARGYLSDPYADVVHSEPATALGPFAPAGQLWSTAGDLARWAGFLAAPDPQVLAPETMAEMRHLHAMADLERWTLGWGLGLMLHRRGERVWAGHGGSMPGFLASVMCSPDEDDPAGVVVLANTSTGADVEGLAGELLETVLDTEPRDPAAWRPGAPPPADVLGMLGRWWSEGSEFVLAWRRDRLEGRSVDAPEHQPPAVFARDGADRWVVVSGREQGELLRVVRAADGSVERMYWAGYPFTRSVHPFRAEPS